jgi:hypothetical protein
MLKSKLVVLDKFSSPEKLSNVGSTRQFFLIFISHPNFRIVFQMERSIDDSAGFISNILGSVFKLINNNWIPFYENIAAKEDHKQDIIASSFNHLKILIESVENSIGIIKPVITASTGRHGAHTKHFQRNDIPIVVVL